MEEVGMAEIQANVGERWGGGEDDEQRTVEHRGVEAVELSGSSRIQAAAAASFVTSFFTNSVMASRSP
ncbi:hypothetical protein JOQ06_010619, partial [Pogonophryne albipinna]